VRPPALLIRLRQVHGLRNEQRGVVVDDPTLLKFGDPNVAKPPMALALHPLANVVEKQAHVVGTPRVVRPPVGERHHHALVATLRRLDAVRPSREAHMHPEVRETLGLRVRLESIEKANQRASIRLDSEGNQRFMPTAFLRCWN
jgi:hypothetical protein